VVRRLTRPKKKRRGHSTGALRLSPISKGRGTRRLRGRLLRKRATTPACNQDLASAILQPESRSFEHFRSFSGPCLALPFVPRLSPQTPAWTRHGRTLLSISVFPVPRRICSGLRGHGRAAQICGSSSWERGRRGHKDDCESANSGRRPSAGAPSAGPSFSAQKCPAPLKSKEGWEDGRLIVMRRRTPSRTAWV